jgi:hypothetical protein
MKILNLTIDAKFVGQVLISTLLGGLIGLGIELWRGNHLAVFLCAVAAGTSAIWRLRKQQLKQNKQTN